MVSLNVKIKKGCFRPCFSSKRSRFKIFKRGDELTFEVEDGEKGPAAVKLQKPLNSNSSILYRSITVNSALFLYLICCILKKKC